MSRLTRSMSLFLVSVVVLGCGVAPAALPPAQSLDSDLTQANTRFGINLFQSLRTEEPTENLFISPTSVSLALSLTANGARGATQQEMIKALSLDALTMDAINQGNADLQTILANPDPKVELSIANSIWYKQGHKVNDTFLEISKNQYKAEVHSAAFGAPAATDAINNWVAKQTKDKIKTILDQTDPDDRMYLINAIYFYGTWNRPFDDKLTQPLPFNLGRGTLGSGSVKQHPMMTQGGKFQYLKGDQFQAVSLPYGEDRVSMYIFLPNSGVNLDQFYQTLTPEAWTDWMGRFVEREGTVTIPKVKLEYKADLIPTMKKLGMEIAFDQSQADFGNLFADSQEQLYIHLILHKTYLDLNEKGTEAAAVTVVGARTTSAPVQIEPFRLLVDRPYFLAIRDNQTGAVLFMGSIVEPQ